VLLDDDPLVARSRQVRVAATLVAGEVVHGEAGFA
jgi:hypothetical protein